VGVVVRGLWCTVAEFLDRAAEAADRRAWRPGTPCFPTSSPGARRYAVLRNGVEHGWETVSGEPERGLRAEADIEGLLDLGEADAGETGHYHFAVDVRGADAQRAYFGSRSPDGSERALVRRRDGHYLVLRDDPALGLVRECFPSAAGGLVGRLSAALFELLTHRLADLQPGGSRVVEMFGPGLPPNYDLDRTALHCWRVGASAGPRRYAVRGVRRNGMFSAVLHCDAAGRLVEVRLAATPPSQFDRLEPPELAGADAVVVRRTQSA
jgi:hypothetical protein